MVTLNNTIIDGKFLHCRKCGKTVGRLIHNLATDEKFIKYDELICSNCGSDLKE